jgi:hypothetical protein
MNEELFINENRIDQKLDKILDKLSEHSAVLERHGVLHEKNAEELEKHIKRTDLLSDHMDAEHRDMKQNLDTGTPSALMTLLKTATWKTLGVSTTQGSRQFWSRQSRN